MSLMSDIIASSGEKKPGPPKDQKPNFLAFDPAAADAVFQNKRTMLFFAYLENATRMELTPYTHSYDKWENLVEAQQENLNLKPLGQGYQMAVCTYAQYVHFTTQNEEVTGKEPLDAVTQLINKPQHLSGIFSRAGCRW